MSYYLNVDEIFEVGLEIERNGKRFYELAAEQVAEPRVRDLCGELAAWEDQHVSLFETLRRELPPEAREGAAFDPNGEEAEAIIAVIEQCPSGALAYSIDGKRVAPKAAANCIVVSADGPYEVSGEITLKDDSRDIDDCAGRLTLCRCGESKNKPFCDGSHWHIGFKDDKN